MKVRRSKADRKILSTLTLYASRAACWPAAPTMGQAHDGTMGYPAAGHVVAGVAEGVCVCWGGGARGWVRWCG